ncbi:MAG: DUF2975 domain-containing protein [Rhodobacteraceae bacterium]|nr:DUF2975 domain-containing protein [Paracoccaceae bacterium]
MEFTYIRRLSAFLRWAVIFTAMALLIMLLGLTLYPPVMNTVVQNSFGDISANGLPLTKHLLLSTLAALLLLPSFRALHMLWRLFTSYTKGAVLSERAAATVKSLGKAILAMGMASILAPTLVVLVLTFDNPADGKQLLIQISASSYLLLLFGGLIMTIGWAMVEAARINTDNKAII